jgi:Sigma-70, region 4
VALAKLPSDQREALLLVGASGFSYEEAAAICESAVWKAYSSLQTRGVDEFLIDKSSRLGPGKRTPMLDKLRLVIDGPAVTLYFVGPGDLQSSLPGPPQPSPKPSLMSAATKGAMLITLSPILR